LSVESSELNVERSAPKGAVFLSYASQDAEAAKRIAAALRAAGVEVWFDQNELVGGDAWDQKIRKQIGSCALFVPIISTNTQARAEGYFRLEWKLADRRTDLIGKSKAFLMPVCIDDTKDSDADVPDSFTAVQWTRLKDGETTPAFVARVKKLLVGGSENVGAALRRDESGPKAHSAGRPSDRLAWIIGGVVALVIAGALGQKFLQRERPAAMPMAGAVTAPALSEARQLAAKARTLFEKDSNNRDGLMLAEDYCQKAVKLDPDDAEVWATAAELSAYFVGSQIDTSPARLEQARMQSERAMQLAPRSTAARFAKASYLRRLGASSLPEAERILRELAAETPGDHRVLIALGKVIWGALGAGQNFARADEALEWFDRAAAIPAGRAEAMGQRGWLLWNLGRLDEADVAIDEALRAGDGTTLFSIKVLIAIARGDLPMARTYYAKLPEEATWRDMGASMGADLWLRSREPEKCLALLAGIPRDYLTSTNFTGPTDLLRGLAYQQAGKTAAARSAWQAALRVVDQRLATNSRDRVALGARAYLLALLGEREAATTALRLYNEIYPDSPTQSRAIRYEPLPTHALLEPADQTVDLIEARTLRSAAGYLRTDYRFDMLRGQPRFEALIKEPANRRTEDGGQRTVLSPDSKSVAVLAFANLSSDKEQEYFSDGISEELLNVLAKVPGLKVSARTSAFHFKGKDTPVPEIARQLGVAYVVEGSVRKQGDKVRITAQLIKAADGFHVWSDTFTRDLKDIFAVQDEIAGLIAQQLQLKLGSPAAIRPVDPEAHRLLLEGRHYWGFRTTDGFDRAEAAFRRALEIEPELAPAHAGLALVMATRVAYRAYIGEPFPSLEPIRSAARRALAITPALPEAQATFAFALLIEGAAAESEREYRKALAMNPNSALLHHWYSLTLENQGRLDEALAEITRATELDPLSGTALFTRHRMAIFAGRYREALDIYDRAEGLLAEQDSALAAHAICLLQLGRTDEAVAIARKVSPNSSLNRRIIADAQVVHVLRATGHAAEAEAHAAAIMSRLLPGSFQRGTILAALGRWDEAEPFLAQTPTTLRYLYLWDPLWDAWRDDPRFHRLMEKLGYRAEYQVARETLARLQSNGGKRK